MLPDAVADIKEQRSGACTVEFAAFDEADRARVELDALGLSNQHVPGAFAKPAAANRSM